MRTSFRVLAALVALFIIGQSPARSAQQPACKKNDGPCQEFAKLMDTDQFDKVVEKTDPNTTYSPEAKAYIGQAYLLIAGREGNTPEQEEMYCKKALQYGATSAYMGLYFINAGKDAETALAYLQQYVATKPRDSVPYVLLGESELDKKNYEAARGYLMEAKKVAHGSSANLDWLLFEAHYLTGDFATASAMLDSAFSQGKTIGDLNELVSTDPRFAEISKKTEFRKFFPVKTGASSLRMDPCS